MYKTLMLGMLLWGSASCNGMPQDGGGTPEPTGSASTVYYAEQTAALTVSTPNTPMPVPGVQVSFNLAVQSSVDLSAAGSLLWDSATCSIRFVVDGLAPARDDVTIGCSANGIRCVGSLANYSFAAVRRVVLEPGSHTVQLTLGTITAGTAPCALMVDPASPPARLYVTTHSATLNPG